MANKLKIFLKTGSLIEIEPPADFNFVLCCQAVRAAGFFNNGMIDISAENINAMVYGADSSVVVEPVYGRGTLQ